MTFKYIHFTLANVQTVMTLPHPSAKCNFSNVKTCTRYSVTVLWVQPSNETIYIICCGYKGTYVYTVAKSFDFLWRLFRLHKCINRNFAGPGSQWRIFKHCCASLLVFLVPNVHWRERECTELMSCAGKNLYNNEHVAIKLVITSYYLLLYDFYSSYRLTW